MPTIPRRIKRSNFSPRSPRANASSHWPARIALALLALAPASIAFATPNEPALAVDSGFNGFTNAWFLGDPFVTVSGGTITSTTNTIYTTKAYYPAPESVYKTYRFGASTYTLTGLSANARYNVRLHFADPTSTGAGQRRFNVLVNGTTVLSSYDIFADVGSNNAVVKQFNTTANASGQVTVQFTNVTGNALINAIEVMPGTWHFINAGTTSGTVGAYQADQYSSGGNVFTTTNAIDTALVHNPAPQKVYQSERYHLTGSLTYTLPNLVPSARYDVRLHFAEIDPNHGYAGARKFNVKLNGTRVLYQYDPFDAGGGLYVATTRTFEVSATTSGQIAILLERVVSDPKISAIEVRPQMTFKFNAGGFVGEGFDNDHAGYLTNPTSTTTLTTTATISQPAAPPGFPAIPYAPQSVYRSARVAPVGGAMTYALAGLVPDKLYRVRLHFAEITTSNNAAGKRVFTVKINNSRVFPHFDIFAAAGAVNRAVVKEATFSAGPTGLLELSFHSETGAAIVNGVEVEIEREATNTGYFASDLGMQVRLGGGFAPSNVFGVDGGLSGLVGNNVVWAYGDSFFPDSPPAPFQTAWNNTGALGSTRDPVHVIEVLDGYGAPTGQLVPMSQAQLSYNQSRNAAYGCTGSLCDGTYHAIWPGAIIRQSNTSGLIISGSAMIFAKPSSPKGLGVITYVQQPGAWATNPTLPSGVNHNVLFPFTERLFTRGFLDDHDPQATPYVYLYRAEAGQMGELATALSTTNTSTTQLRVESHSLCPDQPAGELCGLRDAAVVNQQLELVSGTNRQIVTVTTALGPGPDSNPTIGVSPFKPNFNYPTNTIVQHVGTPIGKLGSSLSAGVARTTVPLANPLPVKLKSGQKLQFWANDATSTQRVQVVTATAEAPAGATSITVSSFTPSITYAANTAVHQTVPEPVPLFGALWNVTYVARAPLASAATRSAYQFWNQKLNNYAGGWDNSMGNGTPMLYTDATFGWFDAPDVRWNAYLNKYLVVRAAQINDGVYISTTTSPQGPWAPETRVTRVHTHESYAGAYFMTQHPELNLGNGQTIHVTYAAAGPGPSDYTGGVRALRLTLP